MFEEALAGGILAQAVGEAGHSVEPAPADGEGAHAVEGRGLAIDGAGGRPGGAPGELILADLIGGQRGGPRGAAEEGGEMGDPAAGGGAGFQPPARTSSDSCNNANKRVLSGRLAPVSGAHTAGRGPGHPADHVDPAPRTS